MPSKRSATRSLSWSIAVTVFAFNIPYVHSYLGNPMSKSILDLTVSLVDRRSLDIDPYAGNSTDIAERGGHFYSGMPPGLSLACVPFYVVAKTWLWAVATPERERAFDQRALAARAGWQPSEKHLSVVLLNLYVCLFGCSVLAGAMAVVFHRALGILYPNLQERRALVTTWLFSFGTLWFVYSPAVYHRVFSTFLCFVACLLVLLPEDRRPSMRRRSLLFGLALGWAIASTYEIVLVAVILALFAATRWKGRWSWGWSAAGAAFFLGLLAAYHAVCFGAPWATPYAARIKGSVLPPVFRAAEGMALFQFKRLIEFFIGSRYGVFFYSPLLLLALPAIRHLRRGDPYRGPAAIGFGIFGSLLVFHYLSGYDGLPGEFGFRMMLPAIPFLMLLLPLSYRWSYRSVLPVLTLLSAVILAKGVMYGVHAGRPFWSDYHRYIADYGFSNYTLANLKDHVWPEISPWLISALHGVTLALVAFAVWKTVWAGRASAPNDQLTDQ